MKVLNKMKKTVTILGRKTDLFLLLASCALSVFITLNTVGSCVCNDAPAPCKCDDKNVPVDSNASNVQANVMVDAISGVGENVFVDNHEEL